MTHKSFRLSPPTVFNYGGQGWHRLLVTDHDFELIQLPILPVRNNYVLKFWDTILPPFDVEPGLMQKKASRNVLTRVSLPIPDWQLSRKHEARMNFSPQFIATVADDDGKAYQIEFWDFFLKRETRLPCSTFMTGDAYDLPGASYPMVDIWNR